MLSSNYPNQTTAAHQDSRLRRRRYQRGSLQKRRHGKQRVWVVQYYDSEGHHRYHTLGRQCDTTKSQASESQADFIRGINRGDAEPDRMRPVLVSEFVNVVYLPFQRGKWKASTRSTSEDRIQLHIVGDLGNMQLESFTPTALQKFLDTKAITHGFSVVDRVRWGPDVNLRSGRCGEAADYQPCESVVYAADREEGSLSGNDRR